MITEEMDYEKLTRQEKMMLEIEEKNRLLEENAKNMKKLINKNNELKKEMVKKDDEIKKTERAISQTKQMI